MPMPLQIFEERYKAMTRELLQSGGEFGVLLIRSGKEVGGGAVPHDIGTTARIEECQEVQGGRFVMTARGGQRFRLVRMLEPRPYPFGEVELMDDSEVITPNVQRAMETVRATFPLYFRLALALTDQWAQGLALPSRPHAMVNFLGPWLQVDEDVRQRLLEIEAPAERVAHLAEVLDDLLARTRDEVAEYRRKKFGAIGSAN